MGNRGILHNGLRQVVRPWAGKSWITCALQFKGIHRTVFSEGAYSELFFLDEATAFAAGHRPCNYCNRQRFREFQTAWLRANRPGAASTNLPIAEIDKVLHAERAVPGGGKAKFSAALDDLPPGTLFEHEDSAFLVWNDAVYRWSFDGYALSPLGITPQLANVLTPMSIVQMYKSGFAPRVHESLANMAIT